MYLPQNQQAPKFITWIETWLIPYRLWVISFLSLIFIAIEFWEEWGGLSGSYHIYLEITSIFLFMVLLAFSWIFLQLLLNSIKEKNSALKILQMKHDLSAQLTITTDWDKLIDLILQFPQTINPLTGASLLIFDPKTAKFEVVAQRKSEDPSSQTALPFRIPETCFSNFHEYSTTLHPINLSIHEDGPHNASQPNVYCLPLPYGETILAKLLFNLPPENILSPEQCDILNHVASDIAIAIASTQQRQEQTTILIGEAQDKERLSISRDLHDTLGQNLVYLRLKLDHIARDIEKVNLSEMRTELEQMREVANKSYEVVRGTLAILHAEEAVPLINLLLDHSRLVVDRSKFKVNITQKGRPQKLKPALLRQIFYIFGEALSNVERHAHAQKVIVKLAWGVEDITIKIADNGRGFDPDMVQKQQHFGLKIMQERTAALGGRFNLQSTHHGTQVTVWFPLVSNDL